MFVTKREAETAIVEAKKPGGSITDALDQTINRYAKRINEPSEHPLTTRTRRQIPVKPYCLCCSN